MLPQPIHAHTDPCALAAWWGLSLELATRLVAFTVLAGDLGLSIISGYRTCDEQTALGAAGRPAAPCDLSTHVACPATGADLLTLPFPVVSVKARFLAEGTLAGLRVGGGSPVDSLGIPSDWNHVDLGPRR